MEIEKIKEIIKLFEETDLTEIEVSEEGKSVRLCRHGIAPAAIAPTIIQQQPAIGETVSNATSANGGNATPPPRHNENHHVITSPMVGTFYISPSPDSRPFVEINQQIRSGETLCIVEAMKMFNQIESEVSGKVINRLVENGEPIEFGQELFIIEKN
ncbi:MAG: acetyl-CoA carboxylase biotin carboxyl carrier protein [Gammaproteobacteria bacterium]|nr:acetyl-CoA carboxylase biotin carboxyl carrier protein [Gammaproteobacteria bacterium]